MNMSNIFEFKLSVSPFLICPTGFNYQEIELIIGSQTLKGTANHLAGHLLNLSRGHICKVICILDFYNKKLVAANVVYSDLLDSKTKRGGLYLIYGAEIEPSLYFNSDEVCQILFHKFHSFFKEQFEADTNLSGIDKIINQFQENKSLEEIMKDISFYSFFGELESKFHYKNKSHINLNFIKLWRLRSKSALPETNPYMDIKHTEEFWKQIDKKISSN